ncbi:hypothetical protein, partial [Escherichia coli]|uniref:hypothetical protein n=1 Tax=Escherichia coli TaxID=562 RepID=UPI0032DB3DFD
MFERLADMVKNKTKGKSLGYGLIVGEILRRKWIDMGQPKPIQANQFLFRVNAKKPSLEDRVDDDEPEDLIPPAPKRRRTPRVVVRSDASGSAHTAANSGNLEENLM